MCNIVEEARAHSPWWKGAGEIPMVMGVMVLVVWFQYHFFVNNVLESVGYGVFTFSFLFFLIRLPASPQQKPVSYPLSYKAFYKNFSYYSSFCCALWIFMYCHLST